MSAPRRTALGSVVYASVLIGLSSGLVIVVTGPWRTGAAVCGGAMLAAGASRLLIPERVAGLLRVRRRSSDALMMLLLGAALVMLAVVVPSQP